MCFALVAQLVEHTLGKGEVSGSNPLKSSITKADMKVSAFVLGVAIRPACCLADGFRSYLAVLWRG